MPYTSAFSLHRCPGLGQLFPEELLNRYGCSSLILFKLSIWALKECLPGCA